MNWKRYIVTVLILTSLAVLSFYSCNKVRNTKAAGAEEKEAEVEMLPERPITDVTGSIEGYVWPAEPTTVITLSNGNDMYRTNASTDGYYIMRNIPEAIYELKMDAKDRKDTTMKVTITKGRTLNTGTVTLKE